MHYSVAVTAAGNTPTAPPLHHYTITQKKKASGMPTRFLQLLQQHGALDTPRTVACHVDGQSWSFPAAGHECPATLRHAWPFTAVFCRAVGGSVRQQTKTISRP
jgi:hypothetical protein